MDHAAPADLTLGAAVEKSPNTKALEQIFDKVEEEREREWREEGRMSRVERQTCEAMTFLATGVSPHTSLLHAVYGLKYSLLETKALANLVRNN